MTHEDRLMAAAKAEDTYNLLNHISWTDVIKPKLEAEKARLSSMLVSDALGTPLPGKMTREQIAGMYYGIDYISHLFEGILRDGEKAVKDLTQLGLHLA